MEPIEKESSLNYRQLGTPSVAAAGLLVDLIRVVPGEDEICSQAPQTSHSLAFFVLGEWDLLRLTLVESFFPRARDVKPWPPLGVQVQNHNSFVAHIWTPKSFDLDSLVDLSRR